MAVRLLNKKEFASLLGVSYKIIDAWEESREVRVVRTGKGLNSKALYDVVGFFKKKGIDHKPYFENIDNNNSTTKTKE